MIVAPAQELLNLAQMAASRHRRFSLPDIFQELGVNLRTAQRMVRAMQSIFPSLTFSTDNDRRR